MRRLSFSAWSLLALFLLAPLLPGASAVSYEEITFRAGVDFRTAGELHHVGEGWPAFTEIFGGGACWGDFDGDGTPDLYLVNQRFNPKNPATGPWADDVDPRDRLYLNQGDGTFEDATDRAGIDGRGRGYACSTADADADGDLDIFVSNLGTDTFLVNDGFAHFTDETDARGFGGHGQCGEVACVTMSSTWADYDRDGDLDLYVTNYVDTHDEDFDRGPGDHIGQLNRLYQNDGTGHFVDVAEHAGVQGNPTDLYGSKSFAAVWQDFDGDNDLDLYVTNDMVENDYYRNDGDGTFTERSNESGLADIRAGMGLTAGDWDGDCRADLFFTHYQGQDNGLYRNNGDGTFTDHSGAGDHNQESWHKVGWGTHFLDFDLDGDQDLITTNGHTEWSIADLSNDTTYAQHFELFRNDDGTGDPDAVEGRLWTAVANESGPSFTKRWVGRGLALADYDLDGDIDFAGVPNANQTANVHRAAGTPDNHWLRIDLRGGIQKNTRGVGAIIEVTAGGHKQCVQTMAGSGYLGQNEGPVTIGLGDRALADQVRVKWPSGVRQDFFDVPADRAVRIYENDPTAYVTDTLSPWTRAVGDGNTTNGWWSEPVTVTLVAQDRAVGVTPSGVATAELRVDGGDWVPNTGQSFSFSDEGVDEIMVRSTDHAGNREPERPVRIGRDFTAPTPMHMIEGDLGWNDWWTSTEVDVVLSGDDALSGIGSVEYRIDGGNWTEYNAPITFASPGGVHEVEYRVADRAGNQAGPVAFTVKHDPVAPIPEFVSPSIRSLYVDGDRVVHHWQLGRTLLITPPSMDADAGFYDVRVATTEEMSGMAWVVLLKDRTLTDVDLGDTLLWTWDTLGEPAGTYDLAAIAVDRAGNSARIDHTYQTVHAAPANEALQGIANGTSVPGSYQAPSTARPAPEPDERPAFVPLATLSSLGVLTLWRRRLL